MDPRNGLTKGVRTARGTVIKMDPESPEWKARIAALLEAAHEGFGEGECNKIVVPGYRSHEVSPF